MLGILALSGMAWWWFFEPDVVPGPAIGEVRRMEVTAMGSNFQWSFVYPSPQGLVVTDELCIPVGTEVDLSLNSADFVYILSVPGLAIRQIAVPGLTHSVRLIPPSAGRYSVVVDPMCGWRFMHEGRDEHVSVLAPDEFTVWLADRCSKRSDSIKNPFCHCLGC